MLKKEKKNVNVENFHINDATMKKISIIKIENRINKKFVAHKKKEKQCRKSCFK